MYNKTEKKQTITHNKHQTTEQYDHFQTTTKAIEIE